MKRSGSHTTVYRQQSPPSATVSPSPRPATPQQYDRTHQHQQLLQQHQHPHLQQPQYHSDFSPPLQRQLQRSGGHRRHGTSNDGGCPSPMPSVESIPTVGADGAPGSTAGFGDVGFPLASRTRTTRSSYQLEEIPENVNSVTSSPVTSAYNVGHERVRRSRRFTITDGSFSPPPVMTSSSELRAQRSSTSGGSNAAAAGAGQPIDFNPPTADWQYGLEDVFNIPIRRTHRGASNLPRSFTPSTPPRRCKPVAGDGNCLFRALSYWICGSDDYHLQVRQVITDELTDNARQYATVTEECGIGASDYVNESGMANEGVWGSDVEIIVAATLMRTPIAVYSAFGDRQYLWQVFEPVPPNSRDDLAAAGGPQSHMCMIYLQNTSNHFEPVVDI